jgi:hypothetical protein
MKVSGGLGKLDDSAIATLLTPIAH